MLIHGAGAWALWLVLPGLGGAASALLLLALGAFAARDRALLRAPGSLSGLEIGEGDRVELSTRDGHRLSGVARTRRHVNRFWVAFSVGAPVRRALFITADMLDPVAFRHLRLWALWGEAARVAPGRRTR